MKYRRFVKNINFYIKHSTSSLIVFVFLITLLIGGCSAGWEEWWTYDGISGPAYWGLLNPDWRMCANGKRQSPINVDPKKLLYDPQLMHLHVDKHKVSGVMYNTGQSVVFRAEENPKLPVNISSGPLSYKYQFAELHLHYGQIDGVGSEHSIDGVKFPAELQLYGFNSHLYRNLSEAKKKPQGMVGVAVMLQLGQVSNGELRVMTSHFDNILFKGYHQRINHMSIKLLMPDTDMYMTYEGSTTTPGCHESVSWVILNKPIYITKQQLYKLRKLMQGEEAHPKAPLGNNFRPSQPVNHRPIRTNIDFKKTKGNDCPTMHKKVLYKAKSWGSRR